MIQCSFRTGSIPCESRSCFSKRCRTAGKRLGGPDSTLPGVGASTRSGAGLKLGAIFDLLAGLVAVAGLTVVECHLGADSETLEGGLGFGGPSWCWHSLAHPWSPSCSRGRSRRRGSPSGSVRHGAPSAFVPALTAADVGWSLPAPVSRAVVTSGPTGVTILGGLDRQQASASGVFHLDPASGALTQAGSLALRDS